MYSGLEVLRASPTPPKEGLFVTSVFFSSIEESIERKRKILFSNRCKKTFAECACKVSFTSLQGNSSLLIVTCGNNALSSLAYFAVAVLPAASLSKAKMISLSCFNSLMAVFISALSLFVP